ncbi:hypothetical protein KFU94_59160 [Chloroflexi bacterium TSY]|nr:hypothetical protein [Chloroflexi bacterium TSY]
MSAIWRRNEWDLFAFDRGLDAIGPNLATLQTLSRDDLDAIVGVVQN